MNYYQSAYAEVTAPSVEYAEQTDSTGLIILGIGAAVALAIILVKR